MSSFLFGTPERNEQRFLGDKDQMSLFQQLLRSIQGPGAGGGFGQSADYYRGLLSDDSRDFDAFAAPELRRFNEQTIPDLAEQFAGLGSGALSSGGFKQSLAGAGTDLSERLAMIRANLRQQGAQGLQNLSGQGLQQMYANVNRPATQGFLSQAAPLIGTALGAIGGPAGAAIGGSIGKAAGGWLDKKFGTTSPYGEG